MDNRNAKQRLVALLFLANLPLWAQAPIRYQLSFPNAAHHEAEIRATFPDVEQSTLEVVMSRSSPGRYSLHEFAKNVYSLRASDENGRPLSVTRAAPNQWNISGHKGAVVVEYTVFGDRVDGTYAAIDLTHAHLNLPAVLVWAHGLENRPVSLSFETPQNSNWKVATQLKPGASGTFTAPNMDFMMDSPVELSAHEIIEWKAGGAQFRMALHQRGTSLETADFAKRTQAIAAEAAGVFGGFPSFDNGNYLFLLDFLPYATGDGMEHRDSTVISGVQPSLGDLAHELFHAWNVERIRPRSLEPFDFERINQSGELWFAEGFTSYYQWLTMTRAGFEPLNRFLNSMGSAVSTVLTAPGHELQSAVEMSQLAGFSDGISFRDPQNTANSYISYYTQGQALALGIDLSIRGSFPGKSLDDWMRAMWRAHPDVNRPYTLKDLEAALASVTSSEFAADTFRRHIAGKEPMPYQNLLPLAGLQLERTRAEKAWLGTSGLEITEPTPRGSAIYNAGLDRGDRIISLGGKAFASQAELDAFLEAHKPGDTVKLKAETRAGTKEVVVVLDPAPGYRIVTRELTPATKSFQDAWLSSKAVPR